MNHFIRTFCRFYGSGFTFVNALKVAYQRTNSKLK